jgi:hypothetical protein
MKINYGTERKEHITADIEHKFAKGWSIDDQAVMIMRQVFRKFPDAGKFQWFVRECTGQLCACRFKVVV